MAVTGVEFAGVSYALPDARNGKPDRILLRNIHLKLEPQFASVATSSELPSVDTIGGQWDGYLENQDLLGLDRDRVRRLGHEYLRDAIEAAG